MTIALVLAVLGGLIGGVFVHETGQGEYYQPQFGPAVMQACGHGFKEYPDPELQRFLARETSRYECPDPYLEWLAAPPSLFAEVERYLFASVSLLWRISGISWDALLPLFAVLFGLASAGLYAVFRLVSSRAVATIGALALITSPGYLAMLRELRDFSKAPFMIIGFFLVALVVRQRFAVRELLLLGGALGVTLGLGFGFRADVFSIVPLFLVAIAAFAAGGLRRDLAGRAAALGAFGVAFALVAGPILLDLRRSGGDGNATLMAIHGATLPFNDALGVEQDLYTPGYLYNDEYATSLVNAHAHHVDGYRGPVQYQTAELERYSQSLYFALARNFPADWALRGRASVERVLELGAYSTTQSPAVPKEVDPLGVPSRLRNVLGDGFRALGGTLLLPLLALLVAAAIRLRAALFALFSAVFLSVLGTVQFSVRHVFYLEIVWWLAAAFLAERLIRAGIVLWRERGRLESLRPERSALISAAVRVGIVVVTLVVLSVGLLIPLRAYQDDHVAALLEQYQRADRTELATVSVPSSSGRTLVRFAPTGAPVWKGPLEGIRSALFVASFSRSRCPSRFVLPIARYPGNEPYFDWSRKLDVRLARAPDSRVEVYFLGFDTPKTRLAGIELPSDQRPCLEGVAAVDTTGLPVLLYTTLPDDWREVTRHATMAKTESRRHVYEGEPFVVASGLRTPTPLTTSVGRTALGEKQAAYKTPAVAFASEGSWAHDAEAETRFSYLVQTLAHKLRKGRFAIVHGVLEEGGLTMGLQSGGVWVRATLVNVTTPGEFYAVLEAPLTGRYSLTVANNVSSDGARNSVRIDSVLWDVSG